MEKDSVTLGKCPPEVKLAILNQLASDQTALAKLSRADKSWNGLCQEFLYAHVRFDWKIGLCSGMWCLITNLFDDRSRRKLVKTISLVGSSHNYLDRIDVSRDERLGNGSGTSVAAAHGSSQATGAAIAWVNHMNLPGRVKKEWVESFTGGHVHSLSFLLLSLCTDLTVLKMGGTFRSDNIFFPWLFSTPQLGPGRNILFTKLRTLDLLQREGLPRPWAETFTDAHRMLSLPQLEAISIQFRKLGSHALAAQFDPIRSTTLKSLSIKGLHEVDLGTVLHDIGPVQCFRWERRGSVLEPPQVRLRTFASAVQKIKDTVQDMVVMHRSDMESHWCPRLGGNLNAMKRLPHLRRLQVPWVFVMSYRIDLTRKLLDVVPPSLEQLTLTDEFMPYGPPEDRVWNASLAEQRGWHWTMTAIFEALKEALRTMPSSYKLRQIILPDVHGGLISDKMRLTLPALTAEKGIQVLWMVNHGNHLWYFDLFGPIRLDRTRDAELLADVWLDNMRICAGDWMMPPFLQEPFLVTGEWPNFFIEFDSELDGFETGLLLDGVEGEFGDGE